MRGWYLMICAKEVMLSSPTSGTECYLKAVPCEPDPHMPFAAFPWEKEQVQWTSKHINIGKFYTDE